MVIGAGLWLAAAAYADVPRLISYQGKLTGASSPVNLTIKFWKSATGTDPNNLLFTEQQNGVPLTSSVFSINIGSQTTGGVPDSALDPGDPNNPNAGVWLGTSINGGAELTPRTRLVMVPYAAKATAAEGLVKPGTFHQVATIDGGELHIVPDAADYPAGLKIGSSAVGDSSMTVRLSQPSGGYVRIQAHKNYGTTYGDISLNADGGNVGIGTLNPRWPLEVRGELQVRALSDDRLVFAADPVAEKVVANRLQVSEFFEVIVAGYTKVGAGMDSAYAGRLATYGPGGNENIVLGSTTTAGRAWLGVKDSGGTAQAGIYVDGSGNGIVWGDTKSFRQPNPNDGGTAIWYACIEGPEAAAYVRGTAKLVNGEAVVELPNHFQAVATEQSMTVQLTALSADSLGLAVVRKGLDSIVVKELYRGTGTYDFDYIVTAVRKGHENYRVIRPATEGLPADTWTSESTRVAPAQEE